MMEDIEITIQAEDIGNFKELIRAGLDALSSDELDVYILGKVILKELS